MGDQLPQAPPASGLGAVDGRAHPGRSQAQQRLGRRAVVPRDEGDRGNRRELAHEARHHRQLVAAAAMHRDHERVHAPRAGGPQHVAERIGVQRCEAAVAYGVDAGALGRGEDGAHGHHATAA